jgi:hypothetical protein
MRRLKWIVPLVVVMSLLISSVAFAAPAQWGGYWYTVRYGDTLFSIGRYTGVNPWSIASANGLPNPNYIWAGQRLWIPGGPSYHPPSPPHYGGCGYWRPVYGGETLYSIAGATGMNAWTIAAANHIYNLNLIYAGMSLWIPCDP